MTPPGNSERAGGEVSELVARCLEQMSAGHVDALDAICREHPSHEAELRERFERLGQLGLMHEPERKPEMIGPFFIVGALGRGGMGQVFLGS